MLRLDSYPTKEYEGYKLRVGHAMPFGATILPDGVNFSVYSREAVSCKLALFHRREREPFVVIPFFDEFRIGNVFTMIVYDLDYEEIEYGYIMDGAYNEKEGYRFDPSKVLLDPYAKLISGRDVWGEAQDTPYHSRIALDDFDWQEDKPLETPMRDLIIYEMHVRGFTRHKSSNVKYPGTFTAVREKIPYLKELGVNCVELMPIFEYDEFENWRINGEGTKLLNYWGYSTVGFFAPKAGLAASGRYSMQVDEFKNLVKELHSNGIEVILDVVFNHTAEGNEHGPYISFRGIDNKVYYMLTPDGYYYNYSGCGNTLNCNHPIVRNMILDCLRYWVAEYHIDGFRFDLATILGRNQDGSPMQNPPLLENLAYDAVLGKCKLIAEAWDAGGLYQVGTFPSWGRWIEWNGKYRDDVRKFLKGENGLSWVMSQYMQGSPHIYNPAYRGNCASVNFITCHDGFTMMDLYSYNDKSNYHNGENNNDGGNDNHSWDCRVPGLDEDQIALLRRRMIKNALAILLLSHGVPMLLAGDEFGNSQGGNNNAYCQDNEISWLNWNDLPKNRDIFEFTQRMIRLRKENECMKSPKDIYRSYTCNGYPCVSFHGTKAWEADYSFGSLVLGLMFCDDDTYIYAGINMHWEAHDMELPIIPDGYVWSVYEDTYDSGVRDADVRDMITVQPRSVVILKSKRL